MASQGSRLVAAGSVDITPDQPLPLAGYAAREGTPLGALDPLEANLLWVVEDTAQVLLVAIDSVAVVPALVEPLAAAIHRATGVPTEAIHVTASHTHSAPSGWVGSIHPVLPAELDRPEVERIVTLVAVAAAALEPRPADLRWAEGHVAKEAAANRHDPHGPHDTRAGVLVAERDGTPVALLYDWACHPTVLGPENLGCSADWVGAARRGLREGLGQVPVVFLQGCAGDVSTRFTRRGRGAEELERVGCLVADAVLDALGDVRAVAPGMLLESTRITLPTRRVAPDEQAEEASSSGDRLAESLTEGAAAGRALAQAELPERIDFPVSWLSLGQVRWLFLPVEPFASLGLAMQGVRVIGYTDDYLGYLPDEAAYDHGHYEACSALVDRATAGAFQDVVADLVRRWSGS